MLRLATWMHMTLTTYTRVGSRELGARGLFCRGWCRYMTRDMYRSVGARGNAPVVSRCTWVGVSSGNVAGLLT